MRHKVANGLCGNAQAGRKHCRDTLDEVFRREWLSSGKLGHNVGKLEGKVAQVLPGRLGS